MTIHAETARGVRVLVTGATGYIGGRLVPRLLEEGYEVCCLVRSPRKLSGRPWADNPRLTVTEGDASDEDAVASAMQGCAAAYYLIHSMLAAGAAYREQDRHLAEVFALAAERADVGRIIYLGGLGETGKKLSKHLASRREVEEVLAAGPVPVTVLRAAMIIGSGSASFEIMRYLVERLPVMVTPRWVTTACQPIAVRDVLHYLVACLDVPETIGRTLDIGGPTVLNYRDFMATLADVRGLPARIVIPVPILSPKLSSLWIHLVTPISARIARPLAAGLRNPVVCRDDEAQRLMPSTRLTAREAIEAAYSHIDDHTVETAWSDAGPVPGDPDWSGGDAFTDRWAVHVRGDAKRVFEAVCRIGGGHGYYAADWLWRLRGRLDRLVGGPGLRRGRRDPTRVRYGEALDFWRVTEISTPKHIALRAEMKVPGDALLEFELRPTERDDVVELVQTARFIPKGLFGLLYWYAVLPLHGFVFRGMLEGIRDEAERGSDLTDEPGEVYRLREPS